MSWPVQKDRRRREMLWAASDVFTALDFNQANMQAIADSAGVTKATLYAYFGDKGQLYRAVIDYWLEELPEPKLPCQASGGLRTCLE
ncbi:TetR/AcrR family transcriptional regulator [Pseudomonas sp. B11D7D]|nr:TetR/AcrR family transcriptional regulator [Pseudomonas sp. B11D7D]QNH04186.1 TetR/AcrR family transcriptional regulator [Pseudomonas sp. B11D7D]